MAEDKGSFGRSGQTSGQLLRMLNEQSLTPQTLFSVPNIHEDIRQNIQVFLRFCSKNKEFTTRLLSICLNSPYSDLKEGSVKKVAQFGIDALTNDEDALCVFLFDKREELKNNSEVEEKIEDQNNPTIQSEAERLFSDSPSVKEEAQWEKKDNAFSKYELVELTLAELKKQNKNQTCLGYTNKLYSSLLRRQGNLFLQFLTNRPEYIDLMVNNINHFSIGNILALLLSCEDKSGQYKHEQLKRKVFDKILQYGLENIENVGNFEGFMATVQQILNSTKQSYYEYFEDFKRCANILVSENVLRKFENNLSKNQVSFMNSSSYLELILKRINVQIEQHDYYKKNQSSEPSMNFQHQFFFDQFDKLLDILGQAQRYSSLSIINYLNFLINLLKNMKQDNFKLKNVEIFKRVLSYFHSEQTKGVIKIYLSQIIKIVLKRTSQIQIKQIAEWILSKNLQQLGLKNILSNQQAVQKNNDEVSCFVLSFLFEIQNKVSSFLSDFTKNNRVNLNEMYEKSTTKLAASNEDEMTSPTSQFQLALKFSKQTNNLFLNRQKDEKDGEIQVVGKNNVMIPVLNLTNKIDKVTVQQEPVEQIKFTTEWSKQDLIRDLKNTRIELPEKFKKKVQDDASKLDVKSELVKDFKLNLKNQQIQLRPSQRIDHVPESPISILIEVGPEQRRYFMKHVLLY